MKQSFIYLGEGLTDLFEFTTLIEYNYKRVDTVVFFHTPKSQQQLSSVALVMQPTSGQHFQGIYIMLNAVKYPYPHSNKKNDIITASANKHHLPIKEIDVQPPETFADKDLYFNYLKSVLRLQNWIPPLQ